jgi:hypothetical protein
MMTLFSEHYAILCEGKKEEYYFDKLLQERFPNLSNKFVVKFKTDKDLQKTLIKKAQVQGTPFSNGFPEPTDLKPLRKFAHETLSSYGFKKIFIVFDRDENDLNTSEPVLPLVEAERLNKQDSTVIEYYYSNPCFEYWLLLYFQLPFVFNDLDPSLPNNHENSDCTKILNLLQNLARYSKKPKQIKADSFNWVYDLCLLSQACNHAETVVQNHITANKPIISRETVPITTIHHLIEALETLNQQQETNK